MELKEMHCKPLSTDADPLSKEQIHDYMIQMPVKWRVFNNKRLKREYPFDSFRTGMAFAKEIEGLAEEEQHHPVVCIEFDKVDVELTTLDVKGLSENDFIMAAKIEDIQIYK